MALITINNESHEYPEGTTFEEIVKPLQKDYNDTIALVIENGKIR